ncbi:MAG: chromosome segregation protein SMC [Ignavibacterium sp.]|nr:chromosome segregation protein SMC [Ignavibacterium sp.]
MYLSKLEIFGFKSFAQKTVINFNEGITSIVGPNGCGKTNVVDAIRWCLGEQRSGVLRSDKMENVIFNGTANRKPMGMAEVSLTIQNTKGILPTEYTDVTITRRIFRSGESEYLLNKNICRLKDITNLFLDTGIGANAYSVIELKMVETILSSKAEERRILFEEAAGVNKYKLRRRLALRKLDEVKADLTRVNDIVSEVEKKVNSLERQAKKADKHTTLSSQLRELELDLAEREFALFHLKIDGLKKSREENFQRKIQVESDIARLEDEIKDARDKLLIIESELLEKRDLITEQTDKIYQVQKSISVKDERKKSLEKNKNKFSEELAELENELKNAEELILNGQANLKKLDEELKIKESEKIKIEERLLQLNIKLEEKRNELKIHSELLLEKVKAISSKENDLKNIEKSLNEFYNRIEKLNEKIQNIANTIAKTVGFVEELGIERDETKKKIDEAEQLYVQKQNEKLKLESELSHLKEKEVEQKSLIKALKEKVEFIQNLIENLEGVSKGAKALLENKSMLRGETTILAHIGNTDEKFRFAVEASLRNNLNNILVESLDDLLKGIEYLRNKKIGKASFFFPPNGNERKQNVFDKLQSYLLKRKAKKLAAEPGFIGWTIDFIESEAKWKNFFNKILQRTCIVDELNTAFELYKKYPEFNFSTLNGDFISSDGIIEAGSEPKLDDSLFGRKQLLENLKNELPVHEHKLIELQKEILWKEEKINAIDLTVLSERGRMLVNDLANVEKQIAQFEYEIKKSNDESDRTQKEIQELAAFANDLDNQKIKVSQELEALKSEQEILDAKQKSLDEEFRKVRNDNQETLNLLNNLKIEIERNIGEIKNTNNAINRAEESISSIKTTIERRKNDIASAISEMQTIQEEFESDNITLQQLETAKDELNKLLEEVDNRYKQSRAEVSKKENDLKQLRNEREMLSNEIHKSEIELKELEMRKDSLIEHIKESYSLNLEKKTFDDLDTFNFADRHSQVQEIKEKIKSLGPVNLLAYSEYEEEKQRLEFLHKQRDDLIESEKDVIKTIDEINQTAQAQFKETFDKIRENFIKIFRTLFDPGDEADLRLEENEDPLEAKIEIIAKPRGKRPQSIDLLSGGEKTLTAIALLFAIYLVKPSPFCILDEIDAPLDDANIDRFTRILHEFKKDTQFIVVTHNKRTMEATETMYGVTMQEEGVSKLVAVRFNEDFDFVDK